MSPKIRLLPPEVSNQIAAGEVVERPASVVKELVENALDAGADEIRVVLEEGGKKLIEVTDNGCGMSPEQARLALERHATSKITSAADLFGVASYGFRGEALPSIAAVSRFTLITRTAAAESAVQLEIEGGSEICESPIGAPVGTRIRVAELFFSVPARKKFLKTVNTERGAALERIQRFAMAHPGVGFTLEHNGRRLFRVTAGDREGERIAQVLGVEAAAELSEIEVGTKAEYRLHAWLGHPRLQRSSSRQLCFFVNRRAVRDKLLLQALLKAYEGILPRGRYPVAALFLEAAPGLVDVNVHPAKEEVRFADSGRIFSLVRQAVAETLSGYPGGSGGDSWAGLAAGVTAPPGSRSEAGDVVSALESGPKRALPPDFFSSPGNVERETQTVGTARVRETPMAATEGGFSRLSMASIPEPVLPSERAAAAMFDSGSTTSEEMLLPGEVAGERGFFSSMYYLGTLWQSYLVLQKGDECYLLDQHAAHERVLFEELKRQPVGVSQPLLLPLTIECTPGEAEIAEARRERLEELGFKVESLGPHTLLLRSRPLLAEDLPPERLLLETLEDLATGGRGDSGLELDELRARLACRLAVKAGRELDRTAVTRLLAQLDQTPRAHTCPHGRPFYFSWSRAEIEKRFQR